MYLSFGGQRSSDSEERVESSLCAALSALHYLLTAVTDPVLTVHRPKQLSTWLHNAVYIKPPT